MQLARVAVQWRDLEPVQGRFRVGELDRLTRMLRRDGIRPIIFVLGSPHWAGPENPGIQCSCDQAADPAWQAMWRHVARRYPDAILDVWNEPNIYLYGSVSVSRVAELTNLTAEAIWSVAPKRTVLSVDRPEQGMGGVRGRALSATRPAHRDGGQPLPWGQLLDNLRHDLVTVKRTADCRPVWITETNLSRFEVGGVRQARYIRRAYRILGRRACVRGVLFHRLWSPYAPEGVGSWTTGSQRSPAAARRCGCTT